MTAVGFWSSFRSYRILRAMLLSVAGISIIQILSGGTGKILEHRVDAPFRWTISYLDTDGHAVSAQVASPEEDSFSEGIAKGPVRLQMDFRECEIFNHYRFWVGPYGQDSTNRQPSEWTVFVRGEDGDWLLADSERAKKAYRNNTWYIFPLHAGKSCIRHVRWDIGKFTGGDIFRLFRFQLYNPALFSMIH
jgi:hypothetical protein